MSFIADTWHEDNAPKESPCNASALCPGTRVRLVCGGQWNGLLGSIIGPWYLDPKMFVIQLDGYKVPLSVAPDALEVIS